jgi:hypothetical protein
MEVEIFRGDISYLLISFRLKAFPEEIGIGEGVTEHPLQLSTVVGIHDNQGVESGARVVVVGGRLITFHEVLKEGS